MKSKIETITPESAREYLKKNAHNRTFRQKAVDRYAADMQMGNWLLTHQGIAFDEKGNLIDGQHRLLAVSQAGVSVQMLVSTGLPISTDNGMELFTQGVIDQMKPRTVADNLQLNHGVENSGRVSAACSVISYICATSKDAPSTSQVVGIYGIYGRFIEKAIEAIRGFKPGYSSPVFGTLAFALASHESELSKFGEQLASGQEMKKGQPVLALRNYLINGGKTTRTWTNRKSSLVEAVGNALYNTVSGNPITQTKLGANGINFFRTKQRNNVERVRLILGLTKPN